MFPWKAVLRGFFLAPLFPCLLILLFAFANDIVRGLPGAFIHPLFLFGYSIVGCYFLMAIFALPLYCLGWRFLRVSLFACLVFGAVIGGAIFLVPFALQYQGALATYDYESLGGTVLVANRHFTHAGVMNRLVGSLEGAVFGVVLAFAFWFFGLRNNPTTQSRRLAKAQ